MASGMGERVFPGLDGANTLTESSLQTRRSNPRKAQDKALVSLGPCTHVGTDAYLQTSIFASMP